MIVRSKDAEERKKSMLIAITTMIPISTTRTILIVKSATQTRFSMLLSGVSNTRIQKSFPQDVLSGREGEGIISHPGNKTMVTGFVLKKEDYCLACNKKEKLLVAMEVV